MTFEQEEALARISNNYPGLWEYDKHPDLAGWIMVPFGRLRINIDPKGFTHLSC